MPRSPSTIGRPRPRARLALAGLAAGIFSAASGPAAAQSAVCQEFGKTLEERKSIISKLSNSGGKKKQVDPRTACSSFGSLVSNGSTALKWLETNKDWCQIPDAFIENIKNDHNRAVDLRGKACKAAAQQAQMEKRGRDGGGGGLLGGDGLTGSFKMPQGAL